MDFKAITSLRPRDEWLPSKDNNLVALPARLSTRDGIRYACDHVLQMAGADLGSLAADHAFPAITPLLELQRPTQHMSFLLGAILAEPGRAAPDVCAGLIFLHHEDGTVSGIPLIMGQNLWHWWTPAKPEHPSAAPADLIAWTGTNAFASYNQRGIALHRLDWHARDGISPVKAISILSGPAAPMIAGMSAGSGQ